MTPRIIAYQPETWSDTIDQIRRTLGAPDNPDLFPPHFLKAAFPKIGGLVAELSQKRRIAGYGFLFPIESWMAKSSIWRSSF